MSILNGASKYLLILPAFIAWATSTLEYSAGYLALKPAIGALEQRINALLDDEEKNGRVLHEDPENTTDISLLRIRDGRIIPGLSTTQGLLLVYHRERPLFKLISPAGEHILAGYYGMSAVMNWDDYDYLKKQLLATCIQGAHVKTAAGGPICLSTSLVYRIDRIEGKDLAPAKSDFLFCR